MFCREVKCELLVYVSRQAFSCLLVHMPKLVLRVYDPFPGDLLAARLYESAVGTDVLGNRAHLTPQANRDKRDAECLLCWLPGTNAPIKSLNSCLHCSVTETLMVRVVEVD